MKQLLEELETLNLPKDEYALWGSAPLVIRGIKVENHDLDILVTKKLWNELAKNHQVQLFQNKTEQGKFITIGRLDFIQHIIGFTETECEAMIKQADIINGYFFVTLKDIIKWKNILQREKDILDIKLIEQYLQNEGDFT